MVLKGFIPPYFAAFLVAEFVLVMQFLWKYIDEIIGKGISFGVLMELVFYFAVTIIPLAIPITILISSVLVFGNLAERHELMSYKSAGISLFRIMGAGMAIAVLTAFFSFFASNYLKPNANYQFLYRFNSVRKQKPSLSIEKGIFNDDFKDFVIRIGEKEEGGNGISDILIYDHSGRTNNLVNVVSAKTGEMYSSEDGSYFVMKLYDGHQYHEEATSLDLETKKRSYPMSRTKFAEWTKVFDMSQFELEALNINTDRKKYDLLNSWQLKSEIDTFQNRQDRIKAKDYFKFAEIYIDAEPEEKVEKVSSPTASIKDNSPKAQLDERKKELSKALAKDVRRNSKPPKKRIPVVPIPDSLELSNILSNYLKLDVQSRYLKSAHINAIRDKDYFFNRRQEFRSLQSYKNIYKLRRHQQFSWALVCVIFLFIGAPLGSIIRKGGYGYSLLVAIFFFMIFIILNILGEKMNKSRTLDPVIAAWLPALVLLPFAIIITIKAINDERFNSKFFSSFAERFRLKKSETS